MLKMTDSGSMVCDAKAAWGTAGGSGMLGWMQSRCERALDASKASVSDYYIHTYEARPSNGSKTVRRAFLSQFQQSCM
jgi:hypothetical protein